MNLFTFWCMQSVRRAHILLFESSSDRMEKLVEFQVSPLYEHFVAQQEVETLAVAQEFIEKAFKLG